MREIKFRAWDARDKKMRYDYMDDGAELAVSFEGVPVSHYGADCCEYYTHKDFILMEFTGLHDKNGKEIWEGDIVRLYPDGGWTDCEVRWIEEKAALALYVPKWGTGSVGHPHLNLSKERPDFFEVIGNIYENPELLTGESKEMES